MIMQLDTPEIFDLLVHDIIIIFEHCAHQLGWRNEPAPATGGP